MREDIHSNPGPVPRPDDDESMTQFEVRLASRTKVPAERLTEFTTWTDERVLRETRVVARVLKRFAEAVVSSMENPASADEFLRGLDLKSISRDHDWRAIFSTIRVQESGYESYKRAVLIKYLQYLSFRKRLLEFIYARKQGLEETDGYTELTHARMAKPDREANHEEGELARLPTGETVELALDRDAMKVDLMLAAHLFRLLSGRPPSIVDQNGVTYYLKPGRNMVGRHPESDVVVDQNFHDVSRAHLVLDWDPEAVTVRVMDLSTRGTYLRQGVLDSASTFVAG